MPAYEYGEPVPVHQTSPFLGQLAPGESLQVGHDMIYYSRHMIFKVNGYVACPSE